MKLPQVDRLLAQLYGSKHVTQASSDNYSTELEVVKGALVVHAPVADANKITGVLFADDPDSSKIMHVYATTHALPTSQYAEYSLVALELDLGGNYGCF